MLQVILYFLIVSIICIIWGLPVFIYPAYKRKAGVIGTETIMFSFFAGLVIIAILSSWISLLLPVKIWALLLPTIALLCIEIFLQKKIRWATDFKFFKKNKPIENIFVFSCLLLFSFLATGKPTMEDSDLYHIQSIKWIHEYGTIPGLANLYLRYGLYSDWFNVISIFQVPWEHQNFLYLNHAFTVWLFLFLFHQYKSFARSTTKVSAHLSLFYLCIILFMLVEWDLFRVATSSTSYDFVVTGLTLICIQLLLKKILLNKQSSEQKNILILLMISAPFFKLTGFFLIPFILFLFFYSKDKRSIAIKTLVVGAAGLGPFLIKNYMQTGYLFFPYQFADVFQSSWKVPREMVSSFNRYIYLSNHYINRAIPKNAWGSSGSFSYYNDWFLHLVTLDKIIIISSLVSFPISLIALKNIYRDQLKKIIGFYFLAVIALLFWLLESPDLRFSFGLLLFVVFFPLTALFAVYIKPWAHSIALIVFIGGIGYYIYQKGKHYPNLENLFYVQSIDVPPYRQEFINNYQFNIPDKINNNWNSRCLDCPMPCVYQINPFLNLLGTRMKYGFKMSPYPDSIFIKNYRY
jgi:hypothetical protein